MRLRLPALTAALLCGAAVAFAHSAAAAAGEASFALKPVTYDPALLATKSYFVLAARPGAVIAEHVRIVNIGGRTGTAYLYPVDATTGQTSGAVYLSRQSKRRDAGAWIRLARGNITLAPHASAVVGFTIRVPRVLHAGDHLGGIVAENSQIQSSNGHGALQIRIRHLTIVAVELQLPGRVTAGLDVTQVRPGGEHGYQYVYLHIRNRGNVLAKSTGKLVITDSHGRAVVTRPFPVDTFVPRTEIDYPVILPRRALVPGRYWATVTLGSDGRQLLGYRQRGVGFHFRHTFGFTVSPRERTKIFAGVPAATPPPRPHPSSGFPTAMLGWIVAALAALVAAASVISRRWSAR